MMHRSSFVVILFLGFCLFLAADAAARPSVSGLTRVSVATSGDQAVGASDRPAISADGRFVAFQSGAANLVPGDTNNVLDVYVHDRKTGVTERVSLASDGTEGNGDSQIPALSADGRFVAFSSDANNLVPGDNNKTSDIFVHDRQTGLTTRISVITGGGEAEGPSLAPAISGDGRFIAFESQAANLVAGDSNNVADIFVHDRQTGVTSRVSVASDGSQANNVSLLAAISADGRIVGFSSNATNLAAADSNGLTDVYIHDRQTGLTEWVSAAAGPAAANGNSYWPSLSADGSLVAFFSEADNLIANDTNNVFDVFVRDRQAGVTERVSVPGPVGQANSGALLADISDDGRYVTYYSDAFNLVPGDNNGQNDVFLFDRQSVKTSLISYGETGQQGNGMSWMMALSGDGTTVAFASLASNLVSGDTNGVQDIFALDLRPKGPATVNLPVILHNYPPTFSISGKVLDANSLPIGGVIISTGPGATAVTDGNGRYQFVDFLAGTYTLTPAKAGFVFTPASRTVTLPPDGVNVDFTAVLVPTPTPSPTPTPTPSPTPQPCSEQVGNGGFETGSAWQISVNAYPAAYETAVAHSGSRSMRAGIINPADNQNSYSSFWQWVNIPVDAPNAALTLWLYPVSGEPGLNRRPSGWQVPDIRQRSLAEDAQFVLIFDQNGQQHTLLYQRQNNQSWTSHQFDLMPYRGQTIQLYFGVFNDGLGGVTGMYVDDVSVQVCR